MTFLGKERDLTPHLVPSDAEIWADAMNFLPCIMTRYYYDEFWLTNQDGTWKVFDLTSNMNEPQKYPNGLPQPPSP